MASEALNLESFESWFRDQGGELDASAMGFAIFADSGRGAIALRDIPEGHTLFCIPRDLTLSLRTSSLPAKFGKDVWKHHELHNGWAGLMLCMMWEESLGASSKWSGYLSSLPTAFTTPMFWTEEDIQELKGTAVVGKIGRDDAERDYHQKLIPAMKSRPDLFPEELIPQYYSLERYHMMGSRILSRSFHVEPWKGEEDHEDEEEHSHADAPQSDDPNRMDVDSENPTGDAVEENAESQNDETSQLELALDEDSDEDEDVENPADVAMVPMADMLNARFESENAKLFYEERHLKMVTTKHIKAGEQIWNTYGDPPNSDLLRRYGHVDVVSLPPPLAGEGNPADVVEVRADLVVSSVRKIRKTAAGDIQSRVDFWLEEADDDTFILTTDCELPEELISFLRLLFLSKDEWNKTKSKGKLPKAKMEPELLPVIADVLKQRLAEYPTSIEEDERLLAPEHAQDLSFNKRNAVVVRLGEKRILRGALHKVEALLGSQKGKDKKRARENEADGRGKKAKR
ncbi:SET domain-containing protein [Obba rivulosa]|uniref:Ribosomal lysine N-methyltransferase 4 n=1 Tax=Obba rivulosa TaxID=1052685 RepID=A0A8E2DJI1_9APHY|nr:SET domain-containing protein [Obba rivulosa]